MKCVPKNKRTLRKRIRKTISLCIFITVILLSSATTLMVGWLFKTQASTMCTYSSYTLSQNMNSPFFLKQMEISDLKDFDPGSPAALDWLSNMESSAQKAFDFSDPMNNPMTDELKGPLISEKNKGHVAPPLAISPQDILSVQISLNNHVVYSNKYQNSGIMKTFEDVYKDFTPAKTLLEYYNVESTQPLRSISGEEIGSVTVKINEGFLMISFILMVLSILFVGFLALIIVNIIGKLFTIPITVPLKQLEQNVAAIAAGDYESTINAKIELKKPLREMESLANSTNVIMNKMKEYNDLLMDQNHELEAQNEELANSKRQIEETQTQLIQAENMAAIGQLTAAITHEINTPLGAINSNVQMCDMLLDALIQNDTLKLDQEFSELTGQIKESGEISILACRRISDIITSLKNFTKIDQAEFQEANINDGIKSVLVLTSNLWKRHIQMHEDYGQIPQVKCYASLLNQVFMNLIVNAIQAFTENGDIYITTWADATHVYTSIRDNGFGMDKEHLNKIFNSGFSTKKTGMGIGLSICQNIIEKHNGTLTVTSELGKGTEFVVGIPL